MMKSGVLGRSTIGDKSGKLLHLSTIFPLVVILIAAALGGFLGKLDVTNCIYVIGAIILAVVIALRQYELVVTMLIAGHLYIDWYLGLELVAPLLALGLLLIYFFARSPQHPWAAPRALWLWFLFLVLTISPVLQGAKGLYDLAYYYPNVIVGALVFFWLGMLVAYNRERLHHLFKILALLGTLLAIHTIIQATTGIVLFGSTRFDAFLAQGSGYALADSNVHRVGSFFVDPNWNGTFFALVIFLPLSLFVESRSLLRKLLYTIEVFLILVALLFTYSNGAWIGAFAGIVAFIIFVGYKYYRILMPLGIVIVTAAVEVIFPTEMKLQLQHASNPAELSLRLGSWQTAIRVISAFPFTGVGLGMDNYLQCAEPYRVVAQYLPLAHPHNSYLELGAMAGLPVLLIFMMLLLFALWQGLRNWLQVEAGTRSLLAGGIAAVVALSINSISINGWTLPPLAALGWLILGAIASPFIVRKQPDGITKENMA